MKHKVGNKYEFLGHIVELALVHSPGLNPHRVRLTCGVSCCTPPDGIKLECHISELDNLTLVEALAECKVEDWKAGDTAVVKEGWDAAGQRRNVLGPAIFQKQWWVPVEDPEDDGPTFQKEASLLKVIKNEDEE